MIEQRLGVEQPPRRNAGQLLVDEPMEPRHSSCRRRRLGGTEHLAHGGHGLPLRPAWDGGSRGGGGQRTLAAHHHRGQCQLHQLMDQREGGVARVGAQAVHPSPPFGEPGHEPRPGVLLQQRLEVASQGRWQLELCPPGALLPAHRHLCQRDGQQAIELRLTDPRCQIFGIEGEDPEQQPAVDVRVLGQQAPGLGHEEGLKHQREQGRVPARRADTRPGDLRRPGGPGSEQGLNVPRGEGPRRPGEKRHHRGLSGQPGGLQQLVHQRRMVLRVTPGRRQEQQQEHRAGQQTPGAAGVQIQWITPWERRLVLSEGSSCL